ncbi:hypothetical protein ACO1PF_11895 [Alkalibacterium sp. f15]|uniref:hypothetical protein n=1 Tax=Alkalibacterium sp. f15 TaxID=3414029 RepID=UPI003BF8603E
MNENVKMNKKRFPWLALTVFSVVLIASVVISLNTAELTVEPEIAELIEANPGVASLGVAIVTGLGVIGGLIGVGIQYLVKRFPTQWIAKDSDVYKNEIWSALFYSSAIGIVLELIGQMLELQGNIALAVLGSIVTTGLFLFFYFSGENKPYHIKKAITIVSVGLLVLNILITVAA